ncbi:hypothetical protein E1218_12795 [Kribbella turkmenica]|uniref:DUF3558 domain-containing protein n=1 Tax=Kribbella turkmenica TaxID=2530375 RepID=A0A4R4X809_9ACTN|nr:hypothetical protein [Kribbella turkmenica]TDD26600.1 hypothetical protein E1218_12795 [Kribbella turkmenica]
MVRRLIALCAAAALAIAAGCSGDDPTAGRIPAPTASATPTPSSIIHTAPSRATPTTPPRVEPEVACGGNPFDPKKLRAYNPDGPAYAGRSIHLSELVNLDFADIYTELPREWNAKLTSTPGAVQLLICEWRDETYRSRTVDTCDYESTDDSRPTAELVSARYRYRVFEAKTARQITTFTLQGSLNGCPASTAGGVSDKYYQRVDSADLAARLKPFVVGPARR